MLDQGLKDESRRLRLESLKVRAEAMRTRISAGHTFCDFAERQARRTSPVEALQTLSKVWHTIEEIDRHIHEPNHIDEKSATALTEQLRLLRERAEKLSAELKK